MHEPRATLPGPPPTADVKLRQHHLRAALEQAGCRYTRQRAAVYEFLAGTEDHPTAEEVYQAVRRRVPRISLATIYKALDSLVQARLANRLSYGDQSARYDCRADPHYHLRDIATGEVHDLEAVFDPGLLEKLDPALPGRLAEAGIEVTGYRLEVLGKFSRRRSSKRSGANTGLAKNRSRD